MSRDIRAELYAFDAGVPLARAWTIPASWYLRPEIHALERDAVFRASWQVACRADEVVEPGRFVAGFAGDLPWLVVRGDDGTLRAFANVCRHKAAILCHGAGVAERLVCPYHGWSYRLDGSLAAAPHTAGMLGGKGWERTRFALPALAVEVWGPLVWVNPDRAAPPLGSSLASLAERLWGADLPRLNYQGRRSWELACNWKVFCDNYLDGGYHVGRVHPSLAAQLAMVGYRTEIGAGWSVQSAGASPADDARARERIGAGAVYAWLWPNAMLNRYGPVLDLNVVHALAPDRCRVDFDFWFDRAALADPQRFIPASMAQSALTQDEDVRICESVQRGMASGTWSRGPLAPAVEGAIHAFHQLLAAALRGGLDGREEALSGLARTGVDPT